MEKLGLKSEVVDLKNYEPEDSLSEEVKNCVILMAVIFKAVTKNDR